MPERLDPSTRLAKLRALGIAEKFPDLLALDALEAAADLEIAALEAKRNAEREAKRARETPIIVPWSATPAELTDVVLFCPERRLYDFKPIEINGQPYTVALPNRTIGFVEDTLRPVLPRHTEYGWFYGSVRGAVFLLECMALSQAIAAVNRLEGDAAPLLKCIYAGVAHSTTPAARSLAEVAYSMLVQFNYAPDGYVHAGDRAERLQNDAEAARIWEMAMVGAPADASVEDPAAQQIRMANEQATGLAARPRSGDRAS